MNDRIDRAPPPAAQDDNRLIAERRGKLAALREQGNPFPNDFRRTATAGALQAQYAHDDKATLAARAATFAVAGRLIRKRGAFLLIRDGAGQIQLYVDRQGLDGATLAAIKQWDLGDIVAARGTVQRSGRGDLYIHMAQARLLTKALRPLPDKYHGLADRELRYRQRYVDLIANEDSRSVFRTRSRIVSHIRRFMDAEGFMEVETPMLHPIPGGAAAKPFVTHHNALDLPMYLRVAPELYLKRLTVGGFERVYEINRNFRNEGLSTRHNPEFTMLEYYWAYADYRDAMNRDMLSRRLRRAGFDTLLAQDGAQALEQIAAQRPGLVLLDMNLPIVDGWSVCRRVRANPQLRDIPIIALTAHAMAEDRDRALAAGCDDYATKPIDFPALLDKIRGLLAP